MLSGLYLKLIAAAVVVAAVLGAWWYVSNLRSENARLTTEVTVLGTKLKDQNDAVIAMKEDADKRLAAAQGQLDAAKQETVAAKKRSTIIYKTVPSTPGDNCKSALDLVNGAAQ
jgi:hypothetical protein